MTLKKDKVRDKDLIKYAKDTKAENEVSIHSMFGECLPDVWSLPEDRVKTTLYLDPTVKLGMKELVKSKRISGCSTLSQMANALFRAVLNPNYAVRIGFWTLVQVNAPLYYFGGRRRPKEKGWAQLVDNCYDPSRGWFHVDEDVLNKNGHGIDCVCTRCRKL
ncbi:hypothetical protein ACFLRN_08025 [Thermoproteota archaeon]